MMCIKPRWCRTVLATEKATSGFLGKIPCHSSMLWPLEELLTKARLSQLAQSFMKCHLLRRSSDTWQGWAFKICMKCTWQCVNWTVYSVFHLPCLAVVKMEGELWWWFELSSLLGWAVEPTEKTNGFWSIRIAPWVIWVQRTLKILHTPP